MTLRPAIFLFTLFFISAIPGRAQSYQHPSTIGINYILNDFKNKSFAGNFSKMDAGLSLGYLKGINNWLDYTVHFAGSFPDSTSGHGTIDNKKHLLLQSDFAIIARPFMAGSFKKPMALQPFATGGIGISY